MPRVNLRKIKSALKKFPTVFLVVIGLLVVVAISAAIILISWDTQPTLKADAATYRLETVTTPEDQARGLGERDSLTQDTGMIFSYDEQNERCFWMKGMRFSIDIIWVDANKTVTHIESGLSPSTFPQKYCHQAKYVIELNAGEAARGGISRGEQLDF